MLCKYTVLCKLLLRRVYASKRPKDRALGRFFGSDTVPTQALGEGLVANHVAIKRHEIERTAGLEGDALCDHCIRFIGTERTHPMPQVHWIMRNGDRVSDDVNDGTNLMDAAQMNGIPGVAGECGGCLSCATCHVYVD